MYNILTISTCSARVFLALGISCWTEPLSGSYGLHNSFQDLRVTIMKVNKWCVQGVQSHGPMSIKLETPWERWSFLIGLNYRSLCSNCVIDICMGQRQQVLTGMICCGFK